MHRPVVHALGSSCAVLVLGVAQAADDVERGAYPVEAFGCGECHTPWTMGPTGSAPAESLSRRPSGRRVAAACAGRAGPWISATSATHSVLGAVGRELRGQFTPDVSGVGASKAHDFIAAMWTGKHLGGGRRILPPMPAGPTGRLSDAELTAMYAYLHTVWPIANLVSEPLPPPPRRDTLSLRSGIGRQDR